MKRPPRDLFVGSIGALSMSIWLSPVTWLSYIAGVLIVVCLFIVVNWPEGTRP